MTRKDSHRKICIVPESQSGGPGSFLRRFKRGVEERGFTTTHDLTDDRIDSILVINATRRLSRLLHHRKRGVRIVQRLGSPASLHPFLPTTWRDTVLAYVRACMVRWVRARCADALVYQSRFVKSEWERLHGMIPLPCTVIYNGIDIEGFGAVKDRYQSPRKHCLISVEGNQGNDPFDIALHLAERLRARGLDFELLMFGNPLYDIEERAAHNPSIRFMGSISPEKLPFYYAGADCYILTDIIGAGCPNSVIESLACGTPVLGYDLGVISEMLDPYSGILVKGAGDPWKGQSPGNFDLLAEAALGICNNRDTYRKGAQRIADERYGLDRMVDNYLEMLFPAGYEGAPF